MESKMRAYLPSVRTIFIAAKSEISTYQSTASLRRHFDPAHKLYWIKGMLQRVRNLLGGSAKDEHGYKCPVGLPSVRAVLPRKRVIYYSGRVGPVEKTIISKYCGLITKKE
ncbi:MAG: hypothetical protein KF862_01340 [Chitinophagaceae bacterium]|nr:hypothetical protein [Chitinophagaceae bacterium]